MFNFNFNKTFNCLIEEQQDSCQIKRYGNDLTKPLKGFLQLNSEEPDLRLDKKDNLKVSHKRSYLSHGFYTLLEKQATTALKFYKKINLDYHLVEETNFNHIFEEKTPPIHVSDKWKNQLEYIVNVCKQRKQSPDQGPLNDSFIISNSFAIGLFLNDMGYRLPDFLEKDSELEHEVIKNIAYDKFVGLYIYKIKEIGVDITVSKSDIKKLKDALEDSFIYIYRCIISEKKPFSTPEQVNYYYDNIIKKIDEAIKPNHPLWNLKKEVLRQKLLQTGTAILERNIREELKKFISIKFQSWYLQKLKTPKNIIALIENNSKNIKKFDNLLKELEVQDAESYFNIGDQIKIANDLNDHACQNKYYNY